MYIPLKVLQSKQCLNAEELSTHQTIAKTLHKYSNKKPVDKPVKDKEETDKSTFSYHNQLQKDIYQWFFSLDLNSRIKVCSISNKWLIHILHQLSLLYFYQLNTQFQMGEFYKEKIDERGANLNFYASFFKVYETTFVPMSQSRNELKKIDNEFYDQIRYTSLAHTNDTVSLKKTVLANQERFFFYFSKLSSDSFTFWIDIEFHDDVKLYNFAKPQWVKDSQSLSLSKIFLSLFEQVIQINYQYCYHIKKLYEYPHYLKFNEAFDAHNNLHQFLMSNDFKKILDNINVNDMLQVIKSDSAIKSEINKQGELNNKVMVISNKKNNYLADKILEMSFLQHIIGQLRALGTVSELIEASNWVTFNSILNYADIVIRVVYRFIQNKYSDSIASDLLEEELLSTSSNPKGKKKKTKKKKKSNNEPLNESLDINLFSKINEGVTLENNSHNIVEAKENVKQNCNENVTANQESSESNTNNISDNDSNPRKKKKQKKKELHLYKIPEKKSKPANQKEQECKTKVKPKGQIQTYAEISTEKATITQSSFSTIKSSIKQTKEDESLDSHISLPKSQQSFPYYQPDSIFSPNNYYYYYNMPIHQEFSPDLFYATLSSDITSFCSKVDRNISLLRDYQIKQQEKLKEIIHSSMSSTYDIELVYFGSYVTNLAIENSDIDILIKYKPKTKEHNSIDNIINTLIIAFNSHKDLFELINPIYTAKVPVIKLRSDLNDEVNEMIKKTLLDNYDFDTKELFKTKFDITFLETEDLAKKSPSQEIVEYVNNALIEYPAIRLIMYVLKRFLQTGNLNSAYKGGLSSFSLFLLLLSYLKYPLNSYSENCKSIGGSLYDFLCFYGSFPYESYSIDSTQSNPFILNVFNDRLTNSKVAIIDPITKHNVAQMSFGILDVKRAFERGHIYLNQFITIQKQEAFSSSSILKGLFNILKH